MLKRLKPKKVKKVFFWHDLENENINRLVPFYLMSCYLYYELDVSVFTDYEFEQLCKKLKANYDKVTHMHKSLVDKEALSASTGYDIKYTNMIKDCAKMWYTESIRYRQG